MEARMTQHPQSNDYWSEVIISSAGSGEPFEDVRVSTLRSHFTDVVCEQAYTLFNMAEQPCTIKDVTELAIDIARTNPQVWKEFVTIAPDGIKVVLDVEAIDDSTTFQAINALAYAVGELVTGEGTVEIGEGRVMTAADLVLVPDSV
jgi:hypothetical protein